MARQYDQPKIARAYDIARAAVPLTSVGGMVCVAVTAAIAFATVSAAATENRRDIVLIQEALESADTDLDIVREQIATGNADAEHMQKTLDSISESVEYIRRRMEAQ